MTQLRKVAKWRIKYSWWWNLASIATVDQVVRFTRPSDSVFAYCKQSKTGAKEGLGMRLEPNSLTFFLSSLPPPLTSPGSNSTVTPGLHIAGVVFSGVSVGVSVGIPILLLTLISCVLRFLLCDDDVCISRAKEWLTVCRCLSRAKEWLTDCGCLSRAKEWLTEAWENRKVTKG